MPHCASSSAAWLAKADQSLARRPPSWLLRRQRSESHDRRSRLGGGHDRLHSGEPLCVATVSQSSPGKGVLSMNAQLTDSYAAEAWTCHRNWGAPGRRTLSAMTAACGARSCSHSSCARSSWYFVPRWSKNTILHESWPNSSPTRRATSLPIPGHTSAAQDRPARSITQRARITCTGSTSKLTTCTVRCCGAPSRAAPSLAQSASLTAVVPMKAPYSTATSAPRAGRDLTASISLSARLPAIFR
mmetsp:Transcript_67001/g.212025  ORF Transcript_67001/g.212025 Transcript_67001/m.212025 type:complete len:244 (-) Transcript_67001:581-1312(-)